MNIFTIKYTVESFAEGVKGKQQKSLTIELPSAVEEITLLKWVQYLELAKAAPQLTDTSEKITVTNWVQFVDFAKKVIELLVTSYTPQERSCFEWKGETYYLPETIRQSFGQVLEGGNLTVGEAADALQLEQIFSATNPDGSPVIQNAKYHNDIALVATLCRRLNPDGTVEVPPLDFIARRKHFDDRLELFSDLPMDIAIDVAFFLTGSNPVLNRIHRLRSLLKTS